MEQKAIQLITSKNKPEIIFYLTFLNFGVLTNIILKLKNNIKSVRPGTMYRIKSELRKEGVPAKIR